MDDQSSVITTEIFIEDEIELDDNVDEEPSKTVKGLHIVSDSIDESKHVDDSVFNHIITASVRKPLWDYKEDLDLIKASQDIVRGLQALAELQITHRGISPGNLFIDERRNDTCGMEIHGLIVDLDYACSGDGFISLYAQLDHNGHLEASVGPLPGSLQFVAVELLRKWQDNKTSGNRTPTHDLESFIWAWYYVQYRRNLERLSDSEIIALDSTRHNLELVFRELFGAQNLRGLVFQRNSVVNNPVYGFTSLSPHLQRVIGEDIDIILTAMLGRLAASYPHDNPLMRKADRFKEKEKRAAWGKLINDSKVVTIEASLQREVEPLIHKGILEMLEIALM
ncbi:hypothetical protein C8Q75DRAFT_805891 [Abortiporus biennis]|nr:hypothetical protein C8Q75DRAFT_805891 [Abortiporus biennis]